MSEKPVFDPNQPSEALDDKYVSLPQVAKTVFDPNQPSEALDDKYASLPQVAKTAVEQGLSGATFGLSKVLETHGIPTLGIPAITTPEEIKARETVNPVTSILSNIGGTAATLGLTGGIGGLVEGAGLATKLGAGILEGAGIGGVTQATDDWSQNKALDAQKIIGSAGLGAALGGAGTLVGAGIKKVIGSPLVRPVQGTVENTVSESIPLKTGVQPTTLDALQQTIETAKANGENLDLPAKQELIDAAQVPSKYPVLPIQTEALESAAKLDKFKSMVEDPENKIGQIINTYQSLQKIESLEQLENEIKSIAPNYTPTSDAIEAGRRVTETLDNVLNSQSKNVGEQIGQLKSSEISNIDHLPNVIESLINPEINGVKNPYANPKLANMLDFNNGEIKIKPFNVNMGIPKKAYSNISDMINSIKEENPNLEQLFDIRKSLGEGVNLAETGNGGTELTKAKAALMSYIQDAIQKVTPDTEVRGAFANYAKTQDAIDFVEKKFGTQIRDWRTKAGDVPESSILGKIFKDDLTTQKLKDILPPEEFNKSLADWLKVSKESPNITKPQTNFFSSNKFGTLIGKKQNALNVAFSDMPEKLQTINHIITKMQLLPDAPSVNPSGTAKTFLQMLKNGKFFNLTKEGLLAEGVKKGANFITNNAERARIDAQLRGITAQNAATGALQNGAKTFTNRMNSAIQHIIRSSTTISRKHNE